MKVHDPHGVQRVIECHSPPVEAKDDEKQKLYLAALDLTC